MEKTSQSKQGEPSIFAQRVYALCRQIPQGKVTTYKELARAAGCNSPRAIGQALRCNPYAPTVPCHRVVASDGSLGGFKGATAGLTIQEKITLLRQEKVPFQGAGINLDKALFVFSKR